MKYVRWFSAGSLACALAASGLWAQEAAAPKEEAKKETVQLRVRAIALPDGKVEVVEETIEGKKVEDPKVGSEAKKFRATIVKETEDEEADENGVRKTIVRRFQQALGGGAAAQRLAADKAAEAQAEAAAALPMSEYWIGVQIADVPPEVRKHMAVKHGILIQHVYPESPAEKAELQVDDVLIQVGDAKVESAADLIKAVDAGKKKELTIKLLREGSEKSLKVTPMKRAEAEKTETLYQPARIDRLQAAERELERALAALKEQNAEKNVVDFMLVRPGAFVHGRPSLHAQLPDDVTIQITKAGNKPASVRVVQGEKKYEATEGKLDSIPAELRGHIERMLSGGPTVMSYSANEAHPHLFEMKVPPPVTGGAIGVRKVAPIPAQKGTPGPAPAVPALPGVPAYPVAPPMPAPPAVTHLPHGIFTAPAPPAATAATPAARVAWAKIATSDSSDAKLDQILKKLDSIASPDLEAMKKEIQSLRKAVEELQKKASGSESSRER